MIGEKRESPWRAWLMALAGVGTAWAGGIGEARAQCPDSPDVGHLCPDVEDHVGWSTCFHVPRNVPGLSGAPQWPADGAVAPFPAGVRPEVSDPRWANAPLRAFQFASTSGGVAVPSSDNAVYRVVQQGDQLFVSIQIQADSSATTWDDFVWFGLATETGDNAWAIKIPAYKTATPGNPTSAVGDYLTPEEARVEWFQFAGGAWTGDLGWPSAAVGSVAWVGADGTALWNNPATEPLNGAIWAVQFRVDLAGLGLSGDAARFAAGAVVTQMVGGATFYSSHNRLACGGGDCRTVGDGPTPVPDPVTGELRFEGGNDYLHHYPVEWTRLSELTGVCTGVSIDRYGIYTALGGGLVNVSPGAANTFIAEPDYGTVDVFPGDMVINYRMSNWGTVADPHAGWNVLGAGAMSGLNSPATLECDNEPGAPNACGIDNVGVHQCLQVALRPSPIGDIPFEQATAYRNTRFQELSALDEVAEIDVRGLQAVLGNADDRVIYLHVVPRNMPDANADPRVMDVAALESLRTQVDTSYARQNGMCSEAEDICYHGVCATPCSGDVEFPCGGDRPIYTDDGCFCPPGYMEKPEYCRQDNDVPPAGGGVDPNVSALDGSQKLQSEYPTYMVYPYYESGRTVMVNGQPQPELVPMPRFGFHVWHEGEYFGFLHGLITGDGQALEEVAPNYYKITVANESVAKVRVLVSAEETPHYTPFSEVSGTATTFGRGFDRLLLAAVTDQCLPVDLGSATVELQSLLSESGTELVASLDAPTTLEVLPGSNQHVATYENADGSIHMHALHLPLIGQVMTVKVKKASVRRPSTCGKFGTAMLTTALSLDDGTNPVVALQGEDQWTCRPFLLTN